VLDDIGWSNWVQNARQLFGTKGGLASSGEGPANRAEGSAERSGALAQLDLDPDGLTAWFAPRGVGATSGYPDDQKQIHIRRRYMLLGQTQDSMQVWDIGRAIRALQFLPPLRELPLHLTASGNMGCNVLYASLFFGTPVKALHLTRLPASHRRGPDYLNVLRFLDIPQTLAMAAERSPIQLAGVSADDWQYAVDVQNRLGWNRLQLDGPK
jgi:hypothetical protein